MCQIRSNFSQLFRGAAKKNKGFPTGIKTATLYPSSIVLGCYTLSGRVADPVGVEPDPDATFKKKRDSDPGSDTDLTL